MGLGNVKRWDTDGVALGDGLEDGNFDGGEFEHLDSEVPSSSGRGSRA